MNRFPQLPRTTFSITSVVSLAYLAEVNVKNGVKVSNSMKKDTLPQVLPLACQREPKKVLCMENVKQIIYLHFKEYKRTCKK